MNHWKIVGGLMAVLLWTGPHDALGQHKQGHADKHAQHKQHQHDDKHDEKRPGLPLCPVMGDPIDFSAKTMTEDGPVYFCCQSCIEKLTKNPHKYAKKVAGQRAALAKRERVQVTCPLTGKPIDKKIFVSHAGRRVYFCCRNCPAKYGEDPARYQAKLAAGYTYQTRCPVRGEKIDPAAFADLATGQRIYFCRPGCDKKFLKDPARYAPQLAAQGINIDLEKLKGDKGEHGHAGHGHP